MPMSQDIQARLDRSMMSNEDDEEHGDDSLSGSMASLMESDPTLATAQATPGADTWFIRRALGPVLKRANSEDDRAARDITPWHLVTQVLNALARTELVRLKVVEEATRALELNERLKKEKQEGEDNGDLLLSSDQKKDLRSLIHPQSCSTLRKNYMLISLQTRTVHIHEDIRARAAGVDELITSYFPQNLTIPTPNIFIDAMKTATREEVKSYTATRRSVYVLYQQVDRWEDELKEHISESVMNGLPQDNNLHFSYIDEFDTKFPPSISWIKVVTLLLAWSKTVQNMINTIQKVFGS